MNAMYMQPIQTLWTVLNDTNYTLYRTWLLIYVQLYRENEKLKQKLLVMKKDSVSESGSPYLESKCTRVSVHMCDVSLFFRIALYFRSHIQLTLCTQDNTKSWRKPRKTLRKSWEERRAVTKQWEKNVILSSKNATTFTLRCEGCEYCSACERDLMWRVWEVCWCIWCEGCERWYWGIWCEGCERCVDVYDVMWEVCWCIWCEGCERCVEVSDVTGVRCVLRYCILCEVCVECREGCVLYVGVNSVFCRGDGSNWYLSLS